MIKICISTVFICAVFFTHGQTIPLNSAGKYEYTEYKNVDDVTKDKLYKMALNWFEKNYGPKKQSLGTIYSQEPKFGEIAASPVMYIDVNSMGSMTSGGSVSYNVIVSVEQEKFKYSFTGFYHESNRSTFGTGGALENETPDCSEEDMSLSTWNEIKETFRQKVESEVLNLKQVMGSAGNEE